MKTLIKFCIALFLFTISFQGVCGSEPKDPPTTLGSFHCSDCEMDLGPVGPNTMMWIKTVVNKFTNGSWITSAYDAKHFFNCNNSICVRIDYVKSGTWIVTKILSGPGNRQFKAIGAAEYGTIDPPHGGGGGDRGNPRPGDRSGYWMGGTGNRCYEYFSNGISVGVMCGIN